MSQVALPHDAKAGPTKPEIRAVALDKLALTPSDHVVEIGSCTGAVTVEAARRAGRVTALERKPDRLSVTRRNLDANDYDADVSLREAEAPDGIPDDADAVFLGGSRNFEAVLDRVVDSDATRVVMNVSRVEVAGDAIEAFRERGILDEVLQVQVSHGYELAGATSFNSENPVYVVVGRDDESGAGTDATNAGGEAE
jgi:cobalt-precorrin-6B (C15)-methyltransferase